MAIPGIASILKYLPASVARKALEKVSPKFSNYFAKALAYGVDANRALDYLSGRFESDSQKQHERQLEKGAQQNTLRPDEMVSRSELRKQAIPGKIARTAAAIGTGGLLGSVGEPGQATEPQARRRGEMETEPSIQKPVPKQLQDQFEEGYGKIGPSRNPSSEASRISGMMQQTPRADEFYTKAFKSLEKNSNVVDSKRIPWLSEARPYYLQGQIETPEDLQEYHQLLQEKLSGETSQSQLSGNSGQLQSDNLSKTLDALLQRIEAMRRS